nr:MAG TPA: hypothetical protein [Caudoviricetes sp.]
MFKNMNKGTKTFVVVYAVCWIISAITCVVMYFKWFSEARELQKRANAVIERDIFKECFDNLQSVGSKMAKYMPSGSEWDDLPDVNDEESFTKWAKNVPDEEPSAQERMLKAYHAEQNREYDEDDDELY